MSESENTLLNAHLNPLLIKEKFKFSFNNSTGILYKEYFGLISPEEIFSSWDYAIINNIIPAETIGFILDYRKATFNFEIRLYGKIADYYQNQIEVFQGRKIGILSENPRDVALLMLFKSKDNGYTTRPFNTEEAAKEWILLNH